VSTWMEENTRVSSHRFNHVLADIGGAGTCELEFNARRIVALQQVQAVLWMIVEERTQESHVARIGYIRRQFDRDTQVAVCVGGRRGPTAEHCQNRCSRARTPVRTSA